MPKTIQFAEGLELPLEIATETLLVVGKRGTGKSNSCVRLAEQLFKAEVPFVALDPTDNWWGLKASRDGKGPGLKIYVFGGRHKDLPLEPTGGALVADVFVDHRISGVLAIRNFSGKDRVRFVTAFCERLLERNSEPLHVFLEEAHELAPQVPEHGEEPMLGAVKKLWTRGRSSGLSGSAITQRPANLSKSVTTQSEVLIVHRILGPQDHSAIKDWIKYHGQSEEILAQLSSLKTGEAFVWAPDFPESKPIGLVRVKVFQRETFDSAATPKAGHKRAEPKFLAPVDIEAISGAMAATIERAKATDPVLLARRVAELERELAAARAKPSKPERIDVPALSAGDMAKLGEVGLSAMRSGEDVRAAAEYIEKAVAGLKSLLGGSSPLRAPMPSAANGRTPLQPSGIAPRTLIAKRVGPAPAPALSYRSEKGVDSFAVDGEKLGGGMLRMLRALAVADQELSREELGARAVIAHSGGTFGTYLSKLRLACLVSDEGSKISITPMGLRAAGELGGSPSSPEGLARAWATELPGKCSAMLNRLIEFYPDWISRDELGAAVGIEASGGTFGTYLSRLRSVGLIETGPSGARSSRAIMLLDPRLERT